MRYAQKIPKSTTVFFNVCCLRKILSELPAVILDCILLASLTAALGSIDLEREQNQESGDDLRDNKGLGIMLRRTVKGLFLR